MIDLMWLLISRELHISWASEDPTLDPVYVSEMYSHTYHLRRLLSKFQDSEHKQVERQPVPKFTHIQYE